MFKKIEEELKNKYNTSNFKVVEQNENIEIFYNDKNLKNDKDFMDVVFDICEKYLVEEDLWRIAILYDYLKELKKVVINAELTTKIDFLSVQDVFKYNTEIVRLSDSIYEVERSISFFSEKYVVKKQNNKISILDKFARKIIKFTNSNTSMIERSTRYNMDKNELYTLSRQNYI